MLKMRCLEGVSIITLFLPIYWAIFFQKFLRNPYLLCTSEVGSTYFPHWVWMGRKLRQGVLPTKDNYYKYPPCIPFLSTFYPPNLLSAWLCRLELDKAFQIYVWLILGHYLVGSMFAYWMFSQMASPLTALFGAITLTYCGYNIKPQTPESAFTIIWIPLIFMKGWIGSFAFGMAILGGYYPPLVYVVPFAIFLNPSMLWGILIGLPQIIPFLWYWPKSVRGKKTESNEFTLNDPKIGRVPWWKFKDLFWPTSSVAPTNGVHYPEVEMYMGIAILFIWNLSWWWVILIYGLMVSIGFLKSIQRIPARSFYLISLCIVHLTLQSGQISELMIFFQCFLLLRNSSIYPSFPFSQWWDKPSKLYSKNYDPYKWPYFTGYLWNGITAGYKGGFSIA